MAQVNIEELYLILDQAISTLRDELKISNVDALVETFDNLEHQTVKVELGAPTEPIVNKLNDLYQQLNYKNLDQKTRLALFKLATLSSIKNDNLDYNHQVTPLPIATVIALMLDKLVPKLADKVILDPAIGSGELLFNTIDQLKQTGKSFKNLIGMDNDDALLAVADINSNLRNDTVNLIHQDSLESWMGERPDIAISDLPAGYYPNDDNAKNFSLHEKEGHSLAHQLFVEQIILNLTSDGVAFLVVPAVLLQSETANTLISWLTKKAEIKAIIDLPEEMFIENKLKKNILVFQKHGKQVHQGKEILLAKLGSLSDPKSLVEFNYRLNEWAKNN